jgi:hypothetical protein
MLPITRGTVRRPQRIVLYAPHGLGKSTLGSGVPDALFIDLEKGTHHLDVARLEPSDLKGFEEIINSLLRDAQGFRTLFIDTLDKLEEFVIADVLRVNDKKSIEAFGYGKGPIIVGERFNDVLALLNKLALKMNIVGLGHVQVKKFELPDSAGAYDRWELKLSKHVRPLVSEWCDALLFGNWKTSTREVEEGDKTKFKGIGGKVRRLFASHSATSDAKNRHGLKEEEEWSVATLNRCLGAPVSTPPAVVVKAAPVAAKPDVAKIAEAVKTVAAASPAELVLAVETPAKIDTTISAKDDTIPHLSPVVDVETSVVTGEHPLSAVVGENEAAANSYLLSRSEIKAGQTFRDVTAKYVERCLRSPAAWVAQFMKGVAA